MASSALEMDPTELTKFSFPVSTTYYAEVALYNIISQHVLDVAIRLSAKASGSSSLTERRKQAALQGRRAVSSSIAVVEDTSGTPKESEVREVMDIALRRIYEAKNGRDPNLVAPLKDVYWKIIYYLMEHERTASSAGAVGAVGAVGAGVHTSETELMTIMTFILKNSDGADASAEREKIQCWIDEEQRCYYVLQMGSSSLPLIHLSRKKSEHNYKDGGAIYPTFGSDGNPVIDVHKPRRASASLIGLSVPVPEPISWTDKRGDNWTDYGRYIKNEEGELVIVYDTPIKMGISMSSSPSIAQTIKTYFKKNL
jgi:hypothetical protein